MRTETPSTLNSDRRRESHVDLLEIRQAAIRDSEQFRTSQRIDTLRKILTDREIGSWTKLHQAESRGMLVEIAFGEEAFLGGAENAKLENVVALFNGTTIHNLQGMARTGPIQSGPHKMEECKAYPIIIRARIPQSLLAPASDSSITQNSTGKNFEVFLSSLNIEQVTEVGVFKIDNHIRSHRWDSQLERLRMLLGPKS